MKTNCKTRFACQRSLEPGFLTAMSSENFRNRSGSLGSLLAGTATAASAGKFTASQSGDLERSLESERGRLVRLLSRGCFMHFLVRGILGVQSSPPGLCWERRTRECGPALFQSTGAAQSNQQMIYLRAGDRLPLCAAVVLLKLLHRALGKAGSEHRPRQPIKTLPQSITVRPDIP